MCRRSIFAFHVLLVLALALPGSVLAGSTTTVIVELDGDPGAVYRAKRAQQGQALSDAQLESYRGQLRLQQDQLLGRLAASGVSATLFKTDVPGYDGRVAATIAHRWTLVLNGMALTLPVEHVPRLQGVAGIKKVHRARELGVQLDRSVPFIRAPQLYGGVQELTAFDDLREGFEGQGTIIAVIDTGVEWQHEMFGGDPTPPRLGVLPSTALVPENRKVIYHLPLGDLAVEDGFGHGTHVASTAAGYLGFTSGSDGIPLNDDDIPVHGVAPQAKIMSYLVCSAVVSTPGSVLGVGPGGCLNVFTITALEDSVSPRTLTGFAKPVASVINLSLGGTYGTADDATAVAASNAALMGAIVVAAAGNSGDVAGIVGSPSTGRRVISVANATDPGSGAEWFADVLAADAFPPSVGGAQVPAGQYAVASGARRGIRVFPMAGTPAPPADSMAQYFVYVDDALTAADYPAAVAGRIALVRLGGASGAFAETANNAALAGAVALLLIGETENATAIRASIPGALIKPADAEYLLGLIGPSPEHGAVSPNPLRLNPAPDEFRADIAASSSRGPVAGFQQIKPDLSAPGTNVTAAVPPGSVIGAIDTEQGANYATISGTSMASPHVAGAAALIKQANPGWTPDRIRTALINSATPMRDASGVPDAYGAHNPKIHAQGGGYVDAHAAATARALMGVRGDGITAPTILGSHAFGEVPVIGSQCVHHETVRIDIVDVRGTGGTYGLWLHANRNVDLPGVELTLSAGQVVVPPNGSASFEAGVRFDGAVIDDLALVDLQWFVVARRSDGAETLSMPMNFRAVPSVPASAGETETVSEVYSGTLGLGSVDAGLGEQYVDIPVVVPGGTFRLQGLLEGDMVTNVAYPDLDLELYDPTGAQIDNSGNPGSVESVDVPVTVAGTYVFRVINYLNHGASFELTVTRHSATGAAPATLDPVPGEHTDASGLTLDFDGGFKLHWSGIGGETAYEIEHSADGGAWESLQIVSASTTSLTLSGLSNGDYAYRVRSHFPGRICTFVAAPSNVVAIRVDRREEVVIGGSVAAAITRIASSGTVWELDLQLTNHAAQAYLAPLRLEIVGLHSSSADITVLNADNGGGGTSAADAAVFDYSTRLGDEVFAAGETSGVRTLRVSNPSGQLFTLDTVVKAHRRVE